ncbi:hypothetical protein BJY52DRAFT_1286531, partial [Lactarius psammicola]
MGKKTLCVYPLPYLLMFDCVAKSLTDGHVYATQRQVHLPNEHISLSNIIRQGKSSSGSQYSQLRTAMSRPPGEMATVTA